MHTIDYSFLNAVNADSTNKAIKCKECNNTMMQFVYSTKNAFDYVKENFNKHELALWIKSNERYIVRKVQHCKSDYVPKQIIFADLGQNLGSELSYEHYCIVIQNISGKVFVVPCSSSAIKRALDGSGNLQDGYEIGEIADGFSKKTAILINDARWISKSRIISTNGLKVSKTLYDRLYDATFKSIFASRHHAFERTKEQLEATNKLLQETAQGKADVETEFAILKGEYNDLKDKYDKLYELIDVQTSIGDKAG